VLVLYDDDCGFCAWTLAWVLRWDRGRRLRPTPIQGSLGQAWLGGLEPAERLASFHVVDARGRLFSAGPALTEILRRLPGGALLAALTARAPRLTQLAYEAVAANRSVLSRPVSASAKARARRLVAEREGLIRS
jgi:predicted DCC family thiol-disulfide oxidoreductase YuxK